MQLGGQFAGSEGSSGSAGALVCPVHPKCVRLGINPGCWLAIGERLCCDAAEIVGLSC